MTDSAKLGLLCHKSSTGELCFKRNGDGSLVYKSSERQYTVIVSPESETVGPLEPYGFVHDVSIWVEHDRFTSGSGMISERSGGTTRSRTFYLEVRQSPAEAYLEFSSSLNPVHSWGYAPGMNFNVTVIDINTGSSTQTSKSVANVEYGSFNITLNFNAEKNLTSIE